ncbi:10964_t:CDS:2 [Rhizophagus irregularis]|nr:10964_t:CDS:2 [Rhizophagus irregularis]
MSQQYSQQLLPECLENILSNLSETKDLYSCLMVNRFWCTVVIPYLWKYPFNIAGTSKERCNMITRTYLSCISEDSRKKLINVGINMSEFPRKPLFDYISYLQSLTIDQNTFDLVPLIFRLKNIKISSKTELQQKIQTMSANDKWIFELQKQSVEQELSKVLLRGCTKLHSLELYKCDFLSNFLKILSSSQQNNQFSCGSLSDDKPTYDLLTIMTKNCKFINSIKIYDIISLKLGKVMASLVSSQNYLTCIELNYSNFYNFTTYEQIFQSLFDDQYNQIQLPPHLQKLYQSKKSSTSSINKKKNNLPPSLNRLKLTKTNLNNIQKHTLDYMIKKCNRLHTLELNNCVSINSLTPLQHSLTKLNNLKVICYEQDLNFITEFFQISNINLKNIYLGWKSNSLPQINSPSQLLFSNALNPISTNSSYNMEESFKRIQILTNHCTQVENLYLETIFPNELLLIFKSLVHLQKLSVTFNEQSNWDEHMEELGENIPKELQWIEIRNKKKLPFNVKGLKGFLEKVKGVNEDLELGFQNSQHSYLNVIKEYDFKINNYDFNW